MNWMIQQKLPAETKWCNQCSATGGKGWQISTGQCHTKLPPDCYLVGVEAARQDGQS